MLEFRWFTKITCIPSVAGAGCILAYIYFAVTQCSSLVLWAKTSQANLLANCAKYIEKNWIGWIEFCILFVNKIEKVTTMLNRNIKHWQILPLIDSCKLYTKPHTAVTAVKPINTLRMLEISELDYCALDIFRCSVVTWHKQLPVPADDRS